MPSEFPATFEATLTTLEPLTLPPLKVPLAEQPPTENELTAAKSLLAIRNNKRLEALHALGRHDRDGGKHAIVSDPSQVDNQVALQLVKLTNSLGAVGGRELASKFLSEPYCLQFAEDFFGYEPRGIALAFQARDIVNQIINLREQTTKPIDPQFTPAMNLAAFIAFEKLHTPELAGLTPQRAAQLLETKGKQNPLWGERNLYRNLARYLKDPTIVKSGMDSLKWTKAVAAKAAIDVHDRLQYWTQLRNTLGQSQGVEVEVLKWTTAQDVPNWSRRYGLDKFLPRGIQPQMLKRRDWRLIGILGLREDLGERAYENFEVASVPTETSSAQVTMLYELMLGGFIEEAQATSGREAYSLHVSTVFPEEIFTHNTPAYKEYVAFARALGGAYSSLPRMKYGGWIGREDSWDYDIFWHERKAKQKLTPVPGQTLSGNELIVEVRTLNVTERDHLSAILNKEFLDFGFRTYWEQQLGVPPKNSRELQAAAVWQDFMSDLQNLNAQYGVVDHWQATANAREKYPRYQLELQQLIRTQATKIRHLAELPESQIQTYEPSGEQPLATSSISTRENTTLESSSLEISEYYLRQLGLQEKGLYTLRVGRTTRTVSITATKENTIGYSPEVKKHLPLQPDLQPRLKFDPNRREIAFGPVVGIAAIPSDPDSPHPFSDILDWPLVSAQLMAAREAGAMVYVFNPEDYDPKKNTLRAYTLKDQTPRPLLQESDAPAYTKTEMPLPDIIFNWAGNKWRSQERYQELFASTRVLNEKSIGKISADKIRFTEMMGEIEALRKRLPETIRYHNSHDIENMLDRYPLVVMKPRWGEEGEGIIYIRRRPNGSYEYSHPHWQRPPGGTEKDETWITPAYTRTVSLEDFLEKTVEIRGESTMILQQGIEMMEFPEVVTPESRKNVEIRTILYRDPNGQLAILGEKEKQKLWFDRLTPLVGKEQAARIVGNAQAVSKLVGLQIDKSLGEAAVTMLAVDVFVDKNGHIWVGEANSAPTVIWYNNPQSHPRLLNELGKNLVLSCATKTGFA